MKKSIVEATALLAVSAGLSSAFAQNSWTVNSVSGYVTPTSNPYNQSAVPVQARDSGTVTNYPTYMITIQPIALSNGWSFSATNNPTPSVYVQAQTPSSTHYYGSWGTWASANGGTLTFGTFSAGNTAATNIPRTGTATYSGGTEARFADLNKGNLTNPYKVEGTTALTVNFGSPSSASAVTLNVNFAHNPLSSTNGPLALVGKSSLAGDSYGSSSGLSGGGLAGSFMGKFYGPGAVVTTGTYVAKNSTQIIAGAYGAGKK